MLRHFFTLAAVLALLLGTVGCSNDSQDSVSSTTGTDGTNMTDEFGGYTASPEAPGFSDPDLLAAASETEGDYGDPILDWPEVDSLVTDANAGRYHLRMLWGQLRLDTSVTTPTDWSGSLDLSRGALVIRRVLKFEDGQDEVLARTDQSLIEWTSQTTVHHDGLAVDLFVPAPQSMIDTSMMEVIDSLYDTTVVEVIDTTTSEVIDTLGDTTFVDIIDTTFTDVIDTMFDTSLVEIIDTITPDYDTVSVTFKTGPFEKTFSLNELAGLDTVYYVDSDSNAVLFQAFKLEPQGCPKGFLTGRWGHDEDGNGVFRGMWMDQHGRASGFVQGHWGVDDNDMRVFFGKWISRNGRFEGFIRGTWKPQPNHHANINAFQHAGGSFSGKIYASDRSEIGVLRGKYRSHPRFENGFFQARWKTYCDKDGDDRGDWDDDEDDMDHDDDDESDDDDYDDDSDDDDIDDGGGF